MAIWNERMKQLREGTTVTLKDMAKLIGVSEATVQRYESGGVNAVPYDAITAYSNVFNVNPAYIMGWDIKTPSARKTSEKPDIIFTVSDKERILIESYRSADKFDKMAVDRILKYAEKIAERKENGKS